MPINMHDQSMLYKVKIAS